VSLLPPEGLKYLFDAVVIFSAIYLFFGFDDLIIDLICWTAGLHPRKLSVDDVNRWSDAPQKLIAIIIPAWKEGHIIGRMLLGNSKRIDYARYYFFVGVYPNDPETIDEVINARNTLPHVVPVINSRPGPTSKGQMLNQVIDRIFTFEKEHGLHFDVIHMQDAEDVIHPKMLSLVNDRLDTFAFVQTPVFSLDVNRGQLVASTYMDEFAEYHTKDILVREHLGAAVPSAGVGTAFSRELVLSFLSAKKSVFNEKSLTEDYELGVTVHAAAYQPHFACCYYLDASSGAREFIATREYFPKQVMRSIRQKARWSLGICLQGWRNLGWVGSASNRYFLYRDRKGIFTSSLVLVGYLLLLICCLQQNLTHEIRTHFFLELLLGSNVLLMINRCFQRMYCVQRVFGLPAALPVPLTWPVASFINAAASISAIKRDIVGRFTHQSAAWVKTEHELPDFFGEPPVKS
jgi:adsorption protein B